MIDGHTVAKHTANELCIVPILRVEAFAQALDSRLVATLVDKLEVVALLAFAVIMLNDKALIHTLRNGNTFFVVL